MVRRPLCPLKYIFTSSTPSIPQMDNFLHTSRFQYSVSESASRLLIFRHSNPYDPSKSVDRKNGESARVERTIQWLTAYSVLNFINPWYFFIAIFLLLLSPGSHSMPKRVCNHWSADNLGVQWQACLTVLSQLCKVGWEELMHLIKFFVRRSRKFDFGLNKYVCVECIIT